MTDTNATPAARRSAAKDKSAAEQIENNPLAIVAGGIALGVVLGALIPRLQKEKELLAPVGKRIAETATAAASAARDVGRAEIDALIPPRAAAKEQIGKIIGNAFTAAKDAAKIRTDA